MPSSVGTGSAWGWRVRVAGAPVLVFRDDPMTGSPMRGKPRLRARNALLRHFGENHDAVEDALSLWCGVYRSVAAYVEVEIEEHVGSLPEWIAAFVDFQGLVELWLDEGRLWILPDRRSGGVHVFLGG